MSQKISTNSYPGTRDFYPQEMRFRSYMFSLIEEAVSSFAYEKISGPILEDFEIFAAKSGEEIAEKQLYVFYDKGERRVAIRPELTPTIARMYAAKINELPKIQRWYSIENFMRYERPQKGRLREFYQVNVDLIGATGVSADFEILSTAQAVFEVFQANPDMYEIRINHRQFVQDIFIDYLGISADLVEKLSKALDKKDKLSQEKFTLLLQEIGLSTEQTTKFNQICQNSFEENFALVPESQGAKELKEILALGEQIFKEKNPLSYHFSVVRGLAYYTGLVFEAFDKNPENTRALFGGGRYDNLVSLFHKNSEISGVGFAIGDVTFESFLRGHGLLSDQDLVVEKHMIALDSAIPLAMFYTISDNIKNMEHIFLDCVSMIENIALSHTGNKTLMLDSLNKVLPLLVKNPFFDKEREGDLSYESDLISFLQASKAKEYRVEIFPDISWDLGKQLKYADKAGIKYVWICGIPELQKGILKRKSMNTGMEEEFDLKTFELY
ncbi:MAG: histidine--tRNA ligase [Brevinema sp.]